MLFRHNRYFLSKYPVLWYITPSSSLFLYPNIQYFDILFRRNPDSELKYFIPFSFLYFLSKHPGLQY